MLEVYLDESGGPDTRVMLMAGVVSSPEKFERLAAGWRQALSEFGLGYFHMKEFVARKGPFSKLTDGQRDALMKRLIALMRKRCVLFVGCAVDAVAYRQVIRGQLRQVFRDPYYLCFRECVNRALDYCTEKDLKGQLAFFVDEKDNFAGHAVRIYTEYKTLEGIPNRELLGPLTYADDKQYPGLQAADIVAWEWAKHLREPARKRQSLIALNSVPCRMKVWNRHHLIGYKQYLRREGFAALISN